MEKLWRKKSGLAPLASLGFADAGFEGELKEKKPARCASGAFMSRSRKRACEARHKKSPDYRQGFFSLVEPTGFEPVSKHRHH